jgi:lipoprotein LpqH
MNRKVVFTATVALAGTVVLTACGGSSNKSSAPAVSTGGQAVVQVNGADLPGLNLGSVACAKAGGKITIGSAAIGGQQGVGVVMTDATPPTVESLGLMYNGTALAVGGGQGSAAVKVDGSTYTITGDAVGADMKNPTAGMQKKSFKIQVSCS